MKKLLWIAVLMLFAGAAVATGITITDVDDPRVQYSLRGYSPGILASTQTPMIVDRVTVGGCASITDSSQQYTYTAGARYRIKVIGNTAYLLEGTNPVADHVTPATDFTDVMPDGSWSDWYVPTGAKVAFIAAENGGTICFISADAN